MSRRGTRLLAWLVVLALSLTFTAWSPAWTPAAAQSATPAANTTSEAGTAPAATASTPGTSGTPTATAGTPGTPTPTRTPTLTPTPTPTLTELQARILLAQTYLGGRDYERAAALFAQILEDNRGNPEALAGLKAALDGQAAQMATSLAPLPTEMPTTVPEAVGPTLAETTRSKLLEIGGTALAALAVVVLLYFLAAFLRWLLAALRELWYMRILPLLRRPAVPPGFLISEFNNAAGVEADGAARVVPLAITEKLIAWNRLVQDRQVPVEMAPDLDLGPMAWIKVLWNWILPPPRGYRVTGTLLNGTAGAFQLAVQRTDLGRNSVDRSAIFEGRSSSVEQAFRLMAAEAAKWLVKPADIEADKAVAAAKRAVGEGAALSASDIFDQALDLLLPVRQQVNQGLVDFPDARQRLRQAEAMVTQLPNASDLRAELTEVIEDLRKSIPGG